MPEMLKDFFFEINEYVMTKEEVEIARDLQRSMGKNPDEMVQCEVCTGIDGEFSYITTHMFFEDLADI
jgi:hypothetical protein